MVIRELKFKYDFYVINNSHPFVNFLPPKLIQIIIVLPACALLVCVLLYFIVLPFTLDK